VLACEYGKNPIQVIKNQVLEKKIFFKKGSGEEGE
jgi:hypothetical protein